jgi:hypothetical protein
MKDLDIGNYKILIKLVVTQVNGNIFHVHGLEVLILLKCPYTPVIYRFM